MTVDEALRQIASGSPAQHQHNTGTHPCSQCEAYIDLAREALGMKPFHEDHEAGGAEDRILDGLAHIAPE